MPRNARDILSFSEHWFRLVKAVGQKQVVAIPYASEADYRATMNEYYGFRKTLRGIPEFEDIYRTAGQIRTYRKGGKVHFHHVETGRFAHLLLDALGPDMEEAFVPPGEPAKESAPQEFVDNESDTVILMSRYFKEGGGKS